MKVIISASVTMPHISESIQRHKCKVFATRAIHSIRFCSYLLFVCLHSSNEQKRLHFLFMLRFSSVFCSTSFVRSFDIQQLHVLKFQIYFSKSEKNFHSPIDFCMTQKIKIYNQIPSAHFISVYVWWHYIRCRFEFAYMFC